MSPWRDLVQSAVINVRARGDITTRKQLAEMAFWRGVARRERNHMSNDHYEWFYTINFGLNRKDYDGRRVLDIGCGPRGSLEWADMADERVGLDPLVGKYRELGISDHKMTYVETGSETIPFPDGYFDIVASFNSLDHVDDLDATIREIARVTAEGGLLLLISDVNHDPTFCEPWSFSWDIVDRFTGFDVVERRFFEKSADSVYASVKAAVPYDQKDERKRYGIISAKLRRVAGNLSGLQSARVTEKS